MIILADLVNYLTAKSSSYTNCFSSVLRKLLICQLKHYEETVATYDQALCLYPNYSFVYNKGIYREHLQRLIKPVLQHIKTLVNSVKPCVTLQM